MWQQSDKFKNKYRIPSARLQGYDYGANGCYYVTICTKNKEHYFGEIVQTNNDVQRNVETDNYPSLPTVPLTAEQPFPHLQPSVIGTIAHQYWLEIPQHFPFVLLDEFVIMPNHIHGILFFVKPDKNDWNANKFGVQSQNLGSVIRGFKSSLKRYANENNIDFAWQERFHDSIIRDNNSLANVREYIFNNPMNWNNDELNDKNVGSAVA